MKKTLAFIALGLVVSAFSQVSISGTNSGSGTGSTGGAAATQMDTTTVSPGTLPNTSTGTVVDPNGPSSGAIIRPKPMPSPRPRATP